ncbi:teichoic acid transporter [Frankia sp. CNm7]|uniref:Teichoic acid transporter n=1 Tax=Frankia nepalensis TaxID=1836974 RepID=A0A937RNL0_9ACTN|nr:teichoic acid transporter [Frankia nepalensis]MBL7514970.1 teichoic acid transporter [Frankia nepalensis]MBL7519201.1 teichoic acid transporter [Frankia nepalensis]MBL7633455.1 teichoic acid transporter [Frankia nepalensis]
MGPAGRAPAQAPAPRDQPPQEQPARDRPARDPRTPGPAPRVPVGGRPDDARAGDGRSPDGPAGAGKAEEGEPERHRGWDNRGLPQPFQSNFMNSFTQTIDLTALRRRLAEEESGRESTTGPRLYGPGRGPGGAVDSEGTQRLFRDPARQRRQPPPGAGEDELGLRDLDAAELPSKPGVGWSPHTGERSKAPGSARSRAIWTLIDQVISSGTNSILMFVVASRVSDSEFGAFSIAFAVFAVVIGFSKSTGGQPLSIRFAGAPESVFAGAAAKATGSAFVLGLLVGVGCALVGAVLGGSVGPPLVILGIVLPGLLVQDLWRQVFFAQGRPAAAAANDALWGVVQVAGVAVLLARDVRVASPMLLAWGAAAAVAALIGVVQAGFWPAPTRALQWIREHRDINGYLAAEFVAVQGALNASFLVIAAVAAIQVNGALRGVQTLLGPTTIFAIGIISWAIPEYSRRKDMSAADRLRAAYRLSAAVATLGIVWGLGFLLIGPIEIGGKPIGERLLGDTWAGTHELLGLSIIQQAGAASTVGVSCMLIALGRARQTFRLNALMAPQLLLYPIIGVAIGGGTGAVCGYIVANWVMVPFWYRLLRRAAREAEQEWAVANGPAPRSDGGDRKQPGGKQLGREQPAQEQSGQDQEQRSQGERVDQRERRPEPRPGRARGASASNT